MKRNRFIDRAIIVVLTILGLIIVRWGVLSLVRDRPVCLFCYRSHLIHNYYHATGISEKCTSDLPSDTIQVYGDPNSIEYEELVGTEFTKYYYNYDGFSINYLTKDGVSFQSSGFTLYSPKIKIRYDIHVGSTREEIINAYAECQEYNDIEDLGCVYLDTGHANALADCVEFIYDENDVVTKIIFYYEPAVH